MMTVTVRSLVITLCLCQPLGRAAPPLTVPLWPGKAPGDAVELPPESNQTRPGDRLIGGRPAVRIINLALAKAKVPAELHLYPTGGHGFGIRRTDVVVTSWPDRAAEWLKASGWLQAAKVRAAP